MRREPRAYLTDARAAIDAIGDFTRGKTFEEFTAQPLLRSAVERQLQIVGEALAQLARLDPALAGRIPDLPRIVAFRNILVHGYAIVDHDQVWSAAQRRLPELRAALERLLAEPGKA
jgi:uncharacterized protein with HEPN domain